MAGFVAVEAEDDALALRCLCVSPAFEARGVANQLVDWAEGVAIDRRLRRLTAFVPAGDHPSLHLYRGHDFVRRRGPRAARDGASREAPARRSRAEAVVDLTLIAVPYDLGREGVGSGRGPEAYLEGGAAEALRDRGHDVEVVTARRERARSQRAAGGPRRRRGRAPRWWLARGGRPPPAGAGRQLQRHARGARRTAGGGRSTATTSAGGWRPSGSTRTATSTRRRPPRPATSTACRWRCSPGDAFPETWVTLGGGRLDEALGAARRRPRPGSRGGRRRWRRRASPW